MNEKNKDDNQQQHRSNDVLKQNIQSYERDVPLVESIVPVRIVRIVATKPSSGIQIENIAGRTRC